MRRAAAWLAGWALLALPTGAVALSPEVAAFRAACAGAQQPPRPEDLAALGWRPVAEPANGSELAHVLGALQTAADLQAHRHAAYVRDLAGRPAYLVVSQRSAEASPAPALSFCRLYIFEAEAPLPPNAFDGWAGAKRLRTRVQIGDALYPIEGGSGVRYRFTSREQAARENVPPGLALSWRTVR